MRELILKILKLFGRDKTASTREQLKNNQDYHNKYADINGINFTSIFATKLATLAVTESNIDIVGNNVRVNILDDCIRDVWADIKKITSMALGTGGCVIIPRVADGKVLFDVVPQNRLIINEKQGGIIKSATVLADSKKINNLKTYYRWIDYRVIDKTILISSRVTDEYGSLAVVEGWENTEPISITNVDRVLLSYLKCPTDTRGMGNIYGVPITYGCDKQIDEIIECLKQIADEFQYKGVRVFADERMFKRDKRSGDLILPSKVFVAGNREGTNATMDIFSPDIRESAYYARLLYLFELLEKAVGTSKGILTATETRGATATEIKASLYDTYSLITDIRSNIERAMNDYIYACNTLINYYGLAGQGVYEIKFDWSYAMVESSYETWQQLKDAQSIGAVSKAELRQFITPSESLDDAQKKIEEIKAIEPTMSDILGNG